MEQGYLFFSFAYCSSVRSSQTPPRPISIPWSRAWRPSRLRFEPPRFAISITFTGLSSMTFRGKEVLQILFKKLAMPALAMHEAHVDAPALGAQCGTAGAKTFSGCVRGWQRDLAPAADSACEAHPGRRGSFSAHDRIIDPVSPFILLWISRPGASSDVYGCPRPANQTPGGAEQMNEITLQLSSRLPSGPSARPRFWLGLPKRADASLLRTGRRSLWGRSWRIRSKLPGPVEACRSRRQFVRVCLAFPFSKSINAEQA
jgi:hypothetical protein